MCKAKYFTSDLLSILNNIETEFVQCSNELSKYDKMQQDILHKIEDGNFNAAQGYKLAKAIQNIRVQRRIVKNEIEPLIQLKSVTSNSLKGLVKVEDAIIKKEEIQQRSKYHPRVLKNESDLKLVVSQ